MAEIYRLVQPPGGSANANELLAFEEEGTTSGEAGPIAQNTSFLTTRGRAFRITGPDGRLSALPGSNRAVAGNPRRPDMKGMESDYVTPRELAAEIKAIEERMDRRHAEISGKVDLVAQSVSAIAQAVSTSAARLDQGLAQIDERFTRLDQAARADSRHVTDNLDKIRSGLETELKSSRSEVRIYTITSIVAIVASILASLGLIYASWGNIMQGFDLGRTLQTEQRNDNPQAGTQGR